MEAEIVTTKRRSNYTEKFKAEALEPILKQGRPEPARAAELKVHPSTLYLWLKELRGEPVRPVVPWQGQRGGGEDRKVQVYKESHSRKWSARLTFPDGTTHRLKTEYTEKKKALMSAASNWGKVARQKGLIDTKPGRRPPHESRTYGLDKTKGHALVAGKGHGRHELQRFAGRVVSKGSPGQKEIRCRALVEVITALEDLQPEDMMWVLRAAVGVADMNGRERLQPTAGAGHGFSNEDQRASRG